MGNNVIVVSAAILAFLGGAASVPPKWLGISAEEAQNVR